MAHLHVGIGQQAVHVAAVGVDLLRLLGNAKALRKWCCVRHSEALQHRASKFSGSALQHLFQQLHGGAVVVGVVAGHAAFLHVGLGQQQAAFLVVGVGAQLGQQALNGRFGVQPLAAADRSPCRSFRPGFALSGFLKKKMAAANRPKTTNKLGYRYFFKAEEDKKCRQRKIGTPLKLAKKSRRQP